MGRPATGQITRRRFGLALFIFFKGQPLARSVAEAWDWLFFSQKVAYSFFPYFLCFFKAGHWQDQQQEVESGAGEAADPQGGQVEDGGGAGGAQQGGQGGQGEQGGQGGPAS